MSCFGVVFWNRGQKEAAEPLNVVQGRGCAHSAVKLLRGKTELTSHQQPRHECFMIIVCILCDGLMLGLCMERLS